MKKLVKESLEEDKTIDDIYDELSPLQRSYVDNILSHGPTIRAIYRDEGFWKNGGWNGMMDAMEYYEDQYDVLRPDFEDIEEKYDIDIYKLLMDEME
jgi:diketogulonate reductase-like aldo/keto reductase